MIDRALNTVKNKFNEIIKPSSKFIIKGREYNEEKLLAEGGYGYVYVVNDSRGQRYALKKMNIISNEQLSNIKREISLWSQVNNSPNIVRLLDFEIGSECVYILMELCIEGSLVDYINNYQGNISEREALHIIKEILNGLNCMHSLTPPISHRDIKIDNVLKFGDTYKLCDFGSASTDTMNPRNETKSSMLDKFSVYERTTTFIYRPPEMCDEYLKYIVNEKVDMWAVGCILYTILFKMHPFQDAQKLTITSAHYFIPDESSRYPPKMIDFIRLLLTPNPVNRPNVAKALQIIQRWSSLQKIDLPQEVEEIKAKQVRIIQERNASKREITADELMKAKASIMKDMKKKNKYKKNDDDFDDLFDDGDEYYRANPEKRAYNKDNYQMKQQQDFNVDTLISDSNEQGRTETNKQPQRQQKGENILGFDFNTGFKEPQPSYQQKSNYNQQIAGFDFSKQPNTGSQANNVQFNFDMNFPQQQPSSFQQNQTYQPLNHNQQYLQQKQYQQNLQYQPQQNHQPNYLNQENQYSQSQQYAHYQPSVKPQQPIQPQMQPNQPQPNNAMNMQYSVPQGNTQKNQNILDFF